MRLLTLFITIIFTTTLHAQSSRWYKGNIHTHSYWSDGDDFPEMIMDWYKSHGYDFISLSDHNILAEGEKWKEIPRHPFRQQRFTEYLKKYGKEWVSHRIDSTGMISVKLKTLLEYRPLFEEPGKFMIMQAEEITDAYKGKPIHLGAVNVKEKILPQGGNSITEVMQNNLDAVHALSRRSGQEMLVHINHPNFQWAIKLEDMIPLRGERFFEVYNGHPHVHNYGDSTVMGMEELWDRLQISFLLAGKPLVYGLATDDAHNYLEYNGANSNPGRGWLMVKATELTPTSIIRAMENGNFYSSTGVTLDDIRVSPKKLEIKVHAEEGLHYKIQFWGAGIKDERGVLLKEVTGTSAAIKLNSKWMYVRAKVISSRLQQNPFAPGDLESAWIQPVKIGALTTVN